MTQICYVAAFLSSYCYNSFAKIGKAQTAKMVHNYHIKHDDIIDDFSTRKNGHNFGVDMK